MKLIDSLLNRITMYRLVVYGLAIVAVAGILLASYGKLAMSPVQMTVSLALFLSSCYIAEAVMARIWQRPYNHESWLITALILFLIVRPPHSGVEALAAFAAGAGATGSKYVVAWYGKHAFNPAALAAAFLSLGNLQAVTWWVGSAKLWPLTLLLGLAIVRKVKRFQMVMVFIAVSLVLELLLLAHHHQTISVGMHDALIASPLIFLSTIMLTEPATMPPRKNLQLIFGAIVAFFYATAIKLGPLYIYPEVALLIGNGYAFAVSPRLRVKMTLKEIQKISSQVYDLVFVPEQRFSFLPGQYMEWTLPGVPFDGRGNRRTFTIASSPSERDVRLGVKFYNPSSTYKHAMSRLRPGDTIYASQLAGNFTLSGNEDKKLAFIAGGIGITPFRSMVKYITDQNIQCDVAVLYFVSKPEELAYKNEFLAAQKLGVRLLPVLNDGQNIQAPGFATAQMSADFIKRALPDYAERAFYISGPDAMVRSAKAMLHSMGIHDIKTDYFSGY